MPGVITTQATLLANNLPEDVFPKDQNDPKMIPIPLIIGIGELLLQGLSLCWKNQSSAGLAQGYSRPSDYLADHYDQNLKQFEPFLLEQTRGQTRLAIRKSHKQSGSPRLRDLTSDQVSAISNQALYQMMTNPGADVSCLAEVSM